MNLPAMRAARDEVADYLEQALELLGPEHQAGLEPRRADMEAGTAMTYVQLARVALERFEEAAR